MPQLDPTSTIIDVAKQKAKQNDVNAMQNAVAALESLDDRDSALRSLVELASDADSPEVLRETAISAFSRFGASSDLRGAVQQNLVNIACNSDYSEAIRETAINSLSHFSSSTDEEGTVQRSLIDLANDPNSPEVRNTAIRALADLGPRAISAWLRAKAPISEYRRWFVLSRAARDGVNVDTSGIDDARRLERIRV